jgi:hypothetical protein
MTSRSVWDDVASWTQRLRPGHTGMRSTDATKQDDESPPSRRFSLDSVTTELRVERMILECRALGIEPDARTIAEIMVDDDIALGVVYR